MKCPAGMTYSESKPLCKRTCENLHQILLSDEECTQTLSGCECLDNTFLNNEQQCVEASECPCLHFGKYYNKGEIIMNDCNAW